MKQLESGLKVILIPQKTTEIVSAGVYIKAGSVNEDDDTNGISHFLEHMMFKGTKKRKDNKIAEELDKIGAVYNAGTSREYTYYYIKGESKYAKLFIDILTDLYCNSVIDQKDIDTERKVIIEEFNMTLDKPIHNLFSLLHKKLFSYSPLKYPILGTLENINSFNRDDFIKFKEKFYLLKNTVIVVAGNFDKKIIFSRIKKNMCFTNDAPINNITITTIVHQKKPYINFTDDTKLNQTHVVFAFRSVNVNHKLFSQLDILSDILTSGNSSKLFHLLRNVYGMTYFSSAYTMSYSTDGLFIIHVGINNGYVYDVIKIILTELGDLVKNGISKNDLIKAKNIKRTSQKLSLLDPYDYMHTYGTWGLFSNEKEYDPFIELNNSLKEVTKKSIHDIIKKTFTTNNINIFVYGTISQVKNKISQINKLIFNNLSNYNESNQSY